ncbi:hypothetical protein BDN72DRAFT_459876 [Pluteus cervinus]|uniref:Uncharacterized protein n=1 Tax=Pluteus cervinus TaxID=181527 RepID=A0ACD3A7R2_9AGAR|nr:hypothetical protein BDN72DRAFT_459876 [Pluteus cervinus]
MLQQGMAEMGENTCMYCGATRTELQVKCQTHFVDRKYGRATNARIRPRRVFARTLCQERWTNLERMAVFKIPTVSQVQGHMDALMSTLRSCSSNTKLDYLYRSFRDRSRCRGRLVAHCVRGTWHHIFLVNGLQQIVNHLRLVLLAMCGRISHDRDIYS